METKPFGNNESSNDKPRFHRAIVRKPCKNMVNGITSANLGPPDFALASRQHDQYIEALLLCGLEVDILPADEEHPDSTFIEDVALLTPRCAIITIPGAVSRKGEAESVIPVIKKYYRDVEFIKAPGTIEPGDIMMAGRHYYIGLSARTNREGAAQMLGILERYGMEGSWVELRDVLHLKTGVAYLEQNNLVAAGEFVSAEAFNQFNIITVGEQEEYAANCIWVNDRVIIPAGYPDTKHKIENCGYQTVEVDVSEFRKLDGGLSCLSLRF